MEHSLQLKNQPIFLHLIFYFCTFFFTQQLMAQKEEWNHEFGDLNTEIKSIRFKNNNLEMAGSSETGIDFDPGEETFFSTDKSWGGNFIATYDTNARPLHAISASQPNKYGDVYSYDTDAKGNNTAIGIKQFYINGIAANNILDSAQFEKVMYDPQGNIFTAGYFYGKTNLGTVQNPYYIFPSQSLGPISEGIHTMPCVDLFIAKYSADGKIIYAKTFNTKYLLWYNKYGDYIRSNVYQISTRDFTVDGDGNPILFTYYHNPLDVDPNEDLKIFTANSFAIAIIKLNGNGQFMWARKIDNVLTTSIYSVVTSKANKDVYVMYKSANQTLERLNAVTGATLSRTVMEGTFKTINNDYPDTRAHGKMVLSEKDEVYIVGNSNSLDFSPGYCSITESFFKYQNSGIITIVAKFSPGLRFLWYKHIHADSHPFIRDLAIDTKDNVYYAGFTYSPSSNYKRFLFGKISQSVSLIMQECNSIIELDSSSTLSGCMNGKVFASVKGGQQHLWFSSKCSNNAIASTDRLQIHKLIGDSLVFVADKNCPAQRLPVRFKFLNTSPKLEVGSTIKDICKGQAIQLKAGADQEVVWNPLIKNGDTITPVGNITYIATTTDKSNCTASASVDIVVHEPVKMEITNLTPDVCQGDSLKLKLDGAEQFQISGIWGQQSPDGFIVNEPYYLVTGLSQACAPKTDTIFTNVITKDFTYDTQDPCYEDTLMGKKIKLSLRSNATSVIWNGNISNHQEVYIKSPIIHLCGYQG